MSFWVSSPSPAPEPDMLRKRRSGLADQRTTGTRELRILSSTRSTAVGVLAGAASTNTRRHGLLSQFTDLEITSAAMLCPAESTIKAEYSEAPSRSQLRA